MSDTSSQHSAACRGPILDPGLVARIHEFNRDYLDLLVLEHRAGATPIPGRVVSALADLPETARRALAAVPFTLYSFGFEDQELWRNALSGALRAPGIDARGLEGRYIAGAGAGLERAFRELAILHAWHVAVSNPMAARIVYSMPPMTATRLAAAPVWHLRWIAATRATLLQPRWPTNPCFWPDLVRFAAAGDPRLKTVQLLGSQLIAAELDAATNDGVRHGVLRSPRLRARQSR